MNFFEKLFSKISGLIRYLLKRKIWLLILIPIIAAVVVAIVLVDLVFLAIDDEAGLADTVGVAGHGGAEEGAAGTLVALGIIITQNNIDQITLSVGNQQGIHGSAEIGDLHDHAVAVFKGIEGRSLSPAVLASFRFSACTTGSRSLTSSRS